MLNTVSVSLTSPSGYSTWKCSSTTAETPVILAGSASGAMRPMSTWKAMAIPPTYLPISRPELASTMRSSAFMTAGLRLPISVNALIDIGKRRPAVMKALLRMVDANSGLEIGKYVGGIAIAFQVDMGRIAPDALPAKITGVSAVVEEHFHVEYPDGEVNETDTVLSMPAPKHSVIDHGFTPVPE